VVNACPREEIARLTALSKSQNMAKTVQKVQTRLREQELVSDVLKAMLASNTSMTREEVGAGGQPQH
jgi:hypothetical protein